MKTVTIRTIRVRRSPIDPSRGRLFAGPLVFACALGRSGVTHFKREGDGASPAARMRVRGGFWRADRWPRPETLIPLRRICPTDGWCDGSFDRRYNRPVTLPYPASAEAMWRDDGLYDFVLDLGWNRGPIRPGRGSAIFLHVARPGFLPTEGCIALEAGALRRLLRLIGPNTEVAIV